MQSNNFLWTAKVKLGDEQNTTTVKSFLEKVNCLNDQLAFSQQTSTRDSPVAMEQQKISAQDDIKIEPILSTQDEKEPITKTEQLETSAHHSPNHLM